MPDTIMMKAIMIVVTFPERLYVSSRRELLYRVRINLALGTWCTQVVHLACAPPAERGGVWYIR